jgi:hypothetical protein
MYVELKTDDPGLIIRVLTEQIEAGKAVRVSVDKAGDLHRLHLSEIGEEASEPI